MRMNVFKEKSDIVREAFRTTLYSMVLMIITTTIGMVVDGMITSRLLGEDAMAAYGLASPGFIICVAVGGVFASGCQAKYSQALGKGDRKLARDVFSVTVITGTAAAVVLAAVIVVFAHPLASLLGADAANTELNGMTSDYLKGLALGLPAIVLCSVLQPLMQIDNDQSRIMSSVLVGLAVNVAGDLSNVFFFKGGLLGMAVATSISYYCSLAVLGAHFFKKDNHIEFSMKQLSLDCSGEILKSGLPTAVSRLCNTLRVLFLNRLILAISGQAAVTALTVQSNINNFFICLPSGIGMTVLIMSGIYEGEGDIRSKKALFGCAIRWCILGIGCFAAVLFTAAPLLSRMYLKGAEEIIPMAQKCLRLYALAMPLYGINMTLMNYCQGCGKLRMANMICIADNLLIVCGIAYLMGMAVGTDGVWWSLVMCELCCLTLVLLSAVLRKGKYGSFEDSLLMIPEQTETVSCTESIREMEDVTAASENIRLFALSNGLSTKESMYLALFTEELGKNIVQYGFDDGKPHSAEFLLKIKPDSVLLRVRDDCRPFDPNKQLELYGNEDPASHIGLRIVGSLADKRTYTNVLRMNNLRIEIGRNKDEQITEQ